MPVCYLEIKRAGNASGNIIINGESNVYSYLKPITEIIDDLKQKYPFLSHWDLRFIKLTI